MVENIFENKIINIVETKGVAAYPWLDVINKIIGWTCQSVKTNFEQTHKNHYELIVPDKLSSQFKFLNHPIIKINALYNLFPSFGLIGITQNQENKDVEIINITSNIDDNSYMLTNIEIVITVKFDINGNVILKNFESTFIHEINHAFEIFCRLKKHDNIDNMLTSNERHLNNPLNNVIINNILYYLLCETEFNALVSQFYGELSELDSKREDFHDDMLKTDVYSVYKNILDNYETVIDNLSIDDVNILQKHFMEYKIPKYKTIKNITSFKNYVKRKIKYLLNDLIKNCGRVAQLYYTEKEKNNEQPKLSQRRIRLASPYVGSEINKD
jgi:hypothetical protein